MLRLIRNNSPFTVLILFIFTLVVKMPVLLHPVEAQLVPGHFLYNYIVRFLFMLVRHSAFAYTFLGVVMLFVQSLYIKALATRHKLYPRYTYVPAFTFLLLTSIYQPFNHFSETVIVNWLLLGAMDIMFSFTQTNQPRKLIFNAALLLSLVALFQFTFLSYFLLLLVGMVLFRPFNIGEWSVAIMGYVTPFYFLACILFLFDKTYLFSQWPHIGFSLSFQSSSVFYYIVLFTGLMILLATGVFAMRQNVSIGNIYVRRDWTAIYYYLFIALAAAWLTDPGVQSAWLMTIPPLSIIISHALLLEKNKRFSNFIFYFSLVYLIVCLWLHK